MRLLAALLSLALVALPAAAQDDPARAEARVHFQRGLELYDDGDLSAALSEFEEAYRISPNPRLLYNLGQVHAELGHAVEAADAYDRFLREADGIDAELRADAERELARARSRIGRVTVTVSVPGARIWIDDVERGSAPLPEPVAVSAGEHLITVQAAGHEALRHRFRIAGGASLAVELALVPSGSRGASLRIESHVPGVEVRVDGISMGITPLDATVPVSAGAHRVEGLRDGYEPYAVEVVAADGSEARVVIQTRPDPGAPASSRAALRLAIPDPSSTLRIDGDVLPAAPSVEVPLGLHDVELRVADREPVVVRVDVPAEGYELTPAYVWTPDARAERLSAASGQRALGLAGMVTGAVMLVAGAVGLGATLAWYEGDVAPRFPYVQACQRIVPTMECAEGLMRFGFPPRAEEAFAADYASRVDTYYGLLGLTVTTLAVSAIATTVGVVLFATAPSDEDVDRGARADLTLHLELGPGHLGLAGSF